MADARSNIPSLPAWPLIGNLLDIQDDVPIRGLERLIDACGPIAKYHTTSGRESIVVGSVAMLQEFLDETRFWKTPPRSLANMKGRSGPKGLFSVASEDEIDWQQAHRTLMPAFGPLAIQDMFDEMFDICSQLILKLARKGPAYDIPVTSEFTKLTLDTIALCAMGFRFNSFYQDDLHPFVQAMNESLTIASDAGKVGVMFQKMMPWDKTDERATADSLYMRKTAHELIQERRNNPSDTHDLLHTMIHGKDPKTGESMSEALITANMVSFLVAGHETTSGLLSFALYLLVTHPEAYAKLQEEIDKVVAGELTVNKLKDLHYINAVLRETLRLHPTAPAFIRSMRSSNKHDFEPVAEGRYAVNRTDEIICLVGRIQRDPAVYGEDANDFRPERMLDDSFNKLPDGAWKPFGTGVRSCIGRAFAWQESQICLALLFTYFDFKLADSTYALRVKQQLTIKPDGLAIRASMRRGMTATKIQRSLLGTSSLSDSSEGSVCSSSSQGGSLTILHGSNTGTCQTLAQRLGRDARRRGYDVSMYSMNDAVRSLPLNRTTIVISASYNGEPPDNADQFVNWLLALKESTALSGVRYTVFGCGHTDWASTYQRVPTVIDEALRKSGAFCVAERGIANAADGNIVQDFDRWLDSTLWPALGASDSATPPGSSHLNVEFFQSASSPDITDGLFDAEVIAAENLTSSPEPEKRHLALQLPKDVLYETGDYMTVLPQNSTDVVASALRHFGISATSSLLIQKGAITFLPTGQLMSVEKLLRERVELSAAMSREDAEVCCSSCMDEVTRSRLSHSTELSLLQVLLQFPSIRLSFGAFLSMLKPMRMRYYSISSSAIASPSVCNLTYSVGNGVAGRYMSGLQPGDKLRAAIQGSNKVFRLPLNIEHTPIVLIGAGTGLAPFRAFLQERACQKASGRTLAPALMLLGCRWSDADRLYASEIDQWAADGIVDARYAYSCNIEASGGCKYVQDLLWMERLAVMQMWRDGAKFYICGSPVVAEQISEVSLRMLRADLELDGKDMTEQEARDWFAARRNVRFVVDTFS